MYLDERTENMDTTAARVAHLVEAHGSRAEAFKTSNFPGYVDMNTIRRAVFGALRTKANGWSTSACDTCEAYAREGQQTDYS